MTPPPPACVEEAEGEETPGGLSHLREAGISCGPFIATARKKNILCWFGRSFTASKFVSAALTRALVFYSESNVLTKAACRAPSIPPPLTPLVCTLSWDERLQLMFVQLRKLIKSNTTYTADVHFGISIFISPSEAPLSLERYLTVLLSRPNIVSRY